MRDQLARQILPAEMDQEEHDEYHGDEDPLDGLEDDDDIGHDLQEIRLNESEMHAEMPLSGSSKGETKGKNNG